jgi:hypothetical protein
MAQYGTTITDIDIPFGRTVAILLRWMFASVIASLVLGLLIFAIVAIVTVLTGGSVAELLKQFPR